MTTLKISKLREFPRELRARLRCLTTGADSDMSNQLDGKDPGAIGVVAFTDICIVGWATVAICRPRSKIADINIFVDPTFRRNAVGRTLMDAIFLQARKLGATRIRAIPFDARSRGFYKAIGFKYDTRMAIGGNFEGVPYSLKVA